jgi:large subunit ribosomal protein L25
VTAVKEEAAAEPVVAAATEPEVAKKGKTDAEAAPAADAKGGKK